MWAPALFNAFALVRVKPKKERRSVKKYLESRKSESAELEFTLFPIFAA